DFLKDIDVLHLFGYGNWYFDLLIPLKSKNNQIKIVISPTFYFDKIFAMQIKSYLSKFTKGLNFYKYKKIIFSLTDSIVVNSLSEKKQLITLFGESLEPKIEVVYNSLEKSFFDLPLNPDCFLERYQLRSGYLLSISFQDERKNSINLIKAFLSVYDKLKIPLVLIGSQRFQSKELNDEFSDLIDNNNDKIIQIEYLNRSTEIDFIKSAILHCRAHVLVSFVETPGLANLEALAFNKPILVGLCDPVKEYFKENAVYCKPNSLKSIEEGILKVSQLKDKPEYSKYVESNFTLDKAINKLTSIYSSI
ncbi:MAG: glycosyltransferase, partial [Bacteroidota bacterium]|nr:glycosyltransferase [Bacteroidota bacterium]